MAVWAPDDDLLIFEHHLGTDQSSSLLNHVTGATVASLTGTWAGGAGYMDINANTGPRLDFGYAIQQRLATVVAVVDANTAMAFLASSGTNPPLPAIARIWIDANPTPGTTRAINGQTVTFVSSGAGAFQSNIGATPQETAANMTTLINAQTTTFGCSAFCPSGNSVIELTANVPGLGGNSIGLTGGGAPVRFTAAAATANVALMSAGGAGEAVSAGLYLVTTNFQGRNSAFGTGGVASIANPGGANFYYLSSVLRERDFPEVRVYSGGTLLGRAFGTTAGRTRDTNAHVWAGLAGGGARATARLPALNCSTAES